MKILFLVFGCVVFFKRALVFKAWSHCGGTVGGVIDFINDQSMFQFINKWDLRALDGKNRSLRAAL